MLQRAARGDWVGGRGAGEGIDGGGERKSRSKSQPEVNTRIRLSIAELCELRGDLDGARREFESGAVLAAARGDAGFFQSWALLESRNEHASPEAEAGAGAGGRGRGGLKGEAVSGRGRGESRPRVGGGSSGSGGGDDESSSSSSSSGGEIRLEPTPARRLFKKAVTTNKFHSASWVAWAKYEQRRGNFDVARRLLVTGISHFPHSKVTLTLP